MRTQNAISYFSLTFVFLLSGPSVHASEGQSWTSVLLLQQSYDNEEGSCPLECLCRSNIIDCKKRNLTNIPSFEDLNSDAIILDLKYNRIPFVPSHHFKKLKRLKTLQLNNNRIKVIKKNAFSGLHNLRHLYLYKNKIRYLDKNIFQDLPKLERVYLHYNNIKSIPDGLLHNLLNLEKIFLGYNKIRTFSKDVLDERHEVKVLRLDRNPLICDCRLNWFVNLLENVGLIGSCYRPPNQKGNRLHQVYRSSQRCNSVVMRKSSSGHSQRNSGGVVSRPFITKEPTDADVAPGGSTFFSCKALGTPLPLILWKKDGQIVSRSLTSFDQGESILRISGASLSDVGSYQCIAKSPAGVATSQVARLRYYRRRSQPRITHSPTRTDVLKGETIRLTCGATGFPQPTFSWFKDGGRLSSFHDRFSVGEDGTLTITNAQLDDSAHYRCSATNYLGRASSAARVRVNLALPDSKPFFTSKPRNANSREGGIVEFTCISSGHPYPDTTWWKNNRIISSDNRITVSDSGQHLRIQNVRLQDRGEYVCRAENDNGMSEVSTNLTVTSRPSPIVMLASPHDMSAPIGSTVQLACRASGYPVPVISWKKDRRSVSELHLGHRMAPDGSLILFNVTRANEGTYECMASNNVESKKAVAVFTVYMSNDGPFTSSSTVSPFQSTLERPTFQPNVSPWRVSSTTTTSTTTTSTTTTSTTSFPSIGLSSLSNNLVPNLDTSASASALFPPESSGPLPGDEFLLTAFDKAQNQVMKAVDETVKALFSGNSTAPPHGLRKIFRYPGANVRELAQATEVFETTLNLIEKAVRSGDIQGADLESNFTYSDLISTENLYLLANLSGCESHRSERDIDCLKDLCFHSKYRSIDGTCNNYEYPLRGASLTTFKRLLPPFYENKFNLPKGWDRNKLYNGYKIPSARLISSSLVRTSSVDMDSELSHMAMQWGQFLDHDIDHSMEAISQKAFEDGITCSGTCGNRPPCFPIEIPLNDPRIFRHRCMEFTRSSATCGSGMTSVFFEDVQYREQLNQLTSYIDGSQVYGSEYDLAQNLRNLTNNFGRLREEQIPLEYPKPFLPFNIDHPVDCRRDPRASNIGCFLTGDVRANEQLGLLSMHTIWFRQHNYLATRLRELNPSWDGDRLYQESRKILGAQMQHITFAHWLPLVLGKKGMEMIGPYSGYDPTSDSSISNVFATAAFRFGHTLINPILLRLNKNFTVIDEGHLSLHEAFFAPWRLVQEGGVDPILRGLFISPAKKPDPSSIMNDELTDKLFEAAHNIALDLGALNIQRGRDHGMPSYLFWREFCGFEAIETWEELAVAIPDEELRSKLKMLYGDVHNMDLWVGGLVEPIMGGAKVGETFMCIIANQFKCLRDGDRFWHENPSVFSPEQLSQIKVSSLGGVICDNGDAIEDVVQNVFVREMVDDKIKTVSCSKIPRLNLNPWFECNENEEHNWRRSSRNRRDAFEEFETKVCIDFDGSIKRQEESWIHKDPSGKCASCKCLDQIIDCSSKLEC